MTPAQEGQRFTVFQIDDDNPLVFGDAVIYNTVDEVMAAGWMVD